MIIKCLLLQVLVSFAILFKDADASALKGFLTRAGVLDKTIYVPVSLYDTDGKHYTCGRLKVKRKDYKPTRNIKLLIGLGTPSDGGVEVKCELKLRTGAFTDIMFRELQANTLQYDGSHLTLVDDTRKVELNPTYTKRFKGIAFKLDEERDDELEEERHDSSSETEPKKKQYFLFERSISLPHIAATRTLKQKALFALLSNNRRPRGELVVVQKNHGAVFHCFTYKDWRDHSAYHLTGNHLGESQLQHCTLEPMQHRRHHADKKEIELEWKKSSPLPLKMKEFATNAALTKLLVVRMIDYRLSRKWTMTCSIGDDQMGAEVVQCETSRAESRPEKITFGPSKSIQMFDSESED